jgi:D-serine deaminase-like pyridoxal phosphate-dependent protein
MSINRRKFVLGAAGLGAAVVGGGLLARPSDHGKPYDDYFSALNQELKKNGPMRPCLVIDLDRMDHNLDLVTGTLGRAGKNYRIVEKSLPSAKLIEYISKRSGSRRLMSFHQPFLNDDAVLFPDADLLLGKPLPVRSAELFYKNHKGPFDPARQLQWLNDTPERVQEYLELARGLGTRMRINIEVDVGLHRGGVSSNAMLAQMLDLIAANPQQLEFSGFMGYDAHVGFGVPPVLGTPRELLGKAMAIYQGYVDFVRSQYPKLWRDDLTFNAGGSPSYPLHDQEKISSEISTGTALLKPTHYDIETLAQHVPAVFIATPVIKAVGPIEVPALDAKSKIFSWWDVNQRDLYYIYGGFWRAEYESPKGLQFNSVLGVSANQENVSGSMATGLKVNDQVFLRPEIVEGVLLQFGDLVAMRGGKIVDYWAPLSA